MRLTWRRIADVAPLASIDITLGTARLVSQLRIIARHVTALADELEAPDGLITFDGKLTEEQVAEIKARFEAAWATGKFEVLCPECHAPESEHHRPECTRTCGRCST